MTNARIAVLGDGGWGTTLAILLSQKKHEVTLWSAFPAYAAALKRKRFNPKFLPGIKIPAGINITHDLAQAAADKDLIVLAIPSEYMRANMRALKQAPDAGQAARDTIFVSVSKGIETGTLARVSEVIREELGKIHLAVLSGPTIAREVALGVPTVAVAASPDKRISAFVQGIFMTPSFRIYTNSDTAGVELGGSLKNVIAIACGISDGIGFGTNTKAALLARGLAEMSRLGHAMGADARTFSGISGLGDLVTTCISSHSRNRFLGEQIGKGKPLRNIITRMQMVAEGLPTAKSAHALGIKYGVDTPIISEVYRVLYKNKSPLKALRDLMTREKKAE